ncbi:MAG: TonB-dependent receptor [Tannerellaceae bacterium]|nr:TonB-dependent receptor [Tannerellaceae bacterium]
MRNVNLRKTFHVTNLIICLLFTGIGVTFATPGYSQTKSLNLEVNNKTLKETFDEIEKNSEFIFFYLDDQVDLNRQVSVNRKESKIDDILSDLFKGTNYTYRISDRQIFVSAKSASPNPQQQTKRKITGRVADDKGEPLIGVSILVKGTNIGAITDIDGQYEIHIEDMPDAVLEFGYVGFKPVDIKIGSRNIYDVHMEELVNELNEMVAIGYGTQRRISNIGAQTSLKMEDIKTPSASLSTALAGRLAGVIAVQRTGEPGKDAADIWIRGIATPNSSSPLVLVDVVERSFNDIDPEDIESLTTLKDASATAVYGVRGANGVIIIKTKPGKIGKPTVNVDYYESFTRFTQKVNLIDGIGYMNAANEALRNDGLAPKFSDDYIRNTQLGRDPYLYPNVDWLNEVFNDWGHNRRVNVNVRGGSERATYYASVSYYNETGMTKTAENIDSYNSKMSYNRYNFTTNLSINATSTTKVEIGAQGYLGEGNYPAISSRDIYDAAMSISPVEYPKMFYINGQAYVPGISPNGGFRNPYADATRRGYNNVTKNQIYSNLRITQDLDVITEGLKLTAMYAFDVYNEVNLNQDRRESTWYFSDLSVPYDLDGHPILTQTMTGSDVLNYKQESSGNKKTYLEASLSYDRKFGDHQVSGLFLFNQQQRLLYPKNTLEEAIPYRMMGIAGRTTYSWKDRYFVEFNIGYNGAENFSPKKRYGTFPAYGVGWVVSNENFWEPLSGIVSFLKIRYTDGKVGNSNVDDRRFMYLDQITQDGNYGYKWGTAGNKYDGYRTVNNAVDLIWEEARKQDLGLDIKLLNDDLSVIFDIFKERRENILLKRENSIPGFLGYMADPYGNVGIVENKGFDGSLEYNKRFGKDWLVSVRGNVTFNNNKWIEGELPEQIYPWMNQNGRNTLASTGYIALGLYTQSEIDDIDRWEALSEENKKTHTTPFPYPIRESKSRRYQIPGFKWRR